MDAVEPERNWDAADATDTSESLPGKRNRAADDAADKSDESPGNQGRRCRVGNLHSHRSSREDGVEMSFTENSPPPPPTSSPRKGDLERRRERGRQKERRGEVSKKGKKK